MRKRVMSVGKWGGLLSREQKVQECDPELFAIAQLGAGASDDDYPGVVTQVAKK